MSAIRETRVTEQGKSYEVVVPWHLAGDTGFKRHLADVLREHLFREGVRAPTT